jgi:hypothetical protein
LEWLDELPRAKVTEAYSLNQMTRLSIIPEDDAELRAAATRLFVLDTTAENMVGRGAELEDAQKDAQLKLHQTAATTKAASLSSCWRYWT